MTERRLDDVFHGGGVEADHEAGDTDCEAQGKGWFGELFKFRPPNSPENFIFRTTTISVI